MENWTPETAESWVLHECWLYRESNPGGIGLFLNTKNLKAGNPSIEQIAGAVEGLKARSMVQGEVGRAFRGRIAHVAHLLLTQKGVDEIKKRAASH